MKKPEETLRAAWGIHTMEEMREMDESHPDYMHGKDVTTPPTVSPVSQGDMENTGK